MPGVLAEQLQSGTLAEQPHLQLVWDADALEELRVQIPEETGFESEVQAEFQQWIGAHAMSGTEVQIELEDQPKVNIHERIEAARAGNAEARRWLEANVDTAIYEGVFKEHVGEIFMDRDEAGELVQHGQTNDEIHYNAIKFRPDRHSILQDVTLAEVENKHRIDAALHAGKLKDHYYVIASLVPNGVPEAQLGSDGDGYFLDALTLNIQATTELADGRVKTETAFMPGVEEKEGDTFEERIERRHDFAAVKGLYGQFGKQAPDTAPELIKTGLYIPKDMMPHGVPDVMYWLDLAKDEALGHDVERDIEDYAGLRLESKRREASLKDMRERVLEDLLASDILTPEEGIEELWELVRIHATQESFTNPNIDPKVLGRAAAPDIIKARQHLEQGDSQAALEYMIRAHEESIVAGCGGGAGSSKKEQERNTLNDILEKIAGSDEFGSLAFICSNGHLCIRPYNEKIAACQHEKCGAKVAC